MSLISTTLLDPTVAAAAANATTTTTTVDVCLTEDTTG